MLPASFVFLGNFCSSGFAEGDNEKGEATEAERIKRE
jgi:hypothetical protein